MYGGAAAAGTEICICESVDILTNYILILFTLLVVSNSYRVLKGRDNGEVLDIYEGWNFNSGNYLFTTDTKQVHVSKFYCPSV